MHLAQHHFQAQARYFEELTGAALGALRFAPYGLVSYELDTEALRSGVVSLVHARGIMRDGLIFQFPPEPAPPTLDVGKSFSPLHDAMPVQLAIPALQRSGANCSLDSEPGSGAMRYRVAEHEVVDEINGQEQRPVAVAVKNFRLVLGDAVPEGLIAIPLAQVRRDGAGHFVYDPDHVPPVVQIGASSPLMQLLARVFEMLASRAETARSERSNAGVSSAEFAAREVASFWLSHAIHSGIAPLRHHLQTRTSHPEEVFVELARLAGALSTFTIDSEPAPLPLYDHDALGACFAALELRIREHLDIILPQRCIRVPLRRADPARDVDTLLQNVRSRPGNVDRLLESFFVAALEPACLAPSDWFLGVRSSAARTEITARVPDRLKVCSARLIVRLVQEGVSGLPLEYLAHPPPDIAPRLDTAYFRIGRDEKWWRSIAESAEVGIYAPAAIPDAELDLLVVPRG